MEIVISGEDKIALKKVENLAKKLGLRISRDSKKEKPDSQSENLFRLLEEAAAADLFKSIDDPVAWQREQQKDRILPGREE